MLFFSYDKIYLLARGNPSKMVYLFHQLRTKEFGAKETLSGNNWIIYPEKLTYTSATHVQVAEFLGLISFRNYADYRCTGKTELSVRDLPSWIDLKILSPSTLWKLQGDTIVFPTETKPNNVI